MYENWLGQFSTAHNRLHNAWQIRSWLIVQNAFSLGVSHLDWMFIERHVIDFKRLLEVTFILGWDYGFIDPGFSSPFISAVFCFEESLIGSIRESQVEQEKQQSPAWLVSFFVFILWSIHCDIFQNKHCVIELRLDHRCFGPGQTFITRNSCYMRALSIVRAFLNQKSWVKTFLSLYSTLTLWVNWR